MKTFLSLLLCLVMALSLAACGGGGQPANNSVPPSEPAQTESTPPVEESTAPAAEFTPVPAGETITLDFMELTIGNVGSGAKLTEGNSSLVTSNESNGYYWLDATLMNTAGQAIPLYNMDVRMVFDDKYTYEGDVRCFTGSDMDPLVQNHIYIYAEIPKTLMDSYQSVTIQFGFNDEFADYDYEQFNYELALENFQNLYEFTYTKGDDTASSASAEGARPHRAKIPAPRPSPPVRPSPPTTMSSPSTPWNSPMRSSPPTPPATTTTTARRAATSTSMWTLR